MKRELLLRNEINGFIFCNKCENFSGELNETHQNLIQSDREQTLAPNKTVDSKKMG